MSSTKQATARERILETASRLFYQHGYHAVGVDTIVAESGVAKMTLYRHFPSKDDLIAAYLEQANKSFWEWLDTTIAPYADNPKRQLIAIFEATAALANNPICYGCTFQHAAAEFPDQAHIGHQVALSHKVEVLQRLETLAQAAHAQDPASLAAQLLLLMDGAWAAVRIFGIQNHSSHLTQAAMTLIESQLVE